MASVIKPSELREMVNNQNFMCCLSGRKLTPETASVDHIVPLARGGQHNASNLCIVDHQVNRAKGTLTRDEFVAMCVEVAKHCTAPDIS